MSSPLIAMLEESSVHYEIGGEHKNVRQGWVGIDCPYCTPNTGKMLLGIREEYNLTTCWQCGVVPFARTLSEITGVDMGTIIQTFSVLRNVPDFEKKTTGTYSEPEGVGELLPAHLRYLKERLQAPLSHVLDVGRVWSLGGIGTAPALSWRLFLPIHRKERKSSWTTRSVKPNAVVPYRSAEPRQESFHHKDWLYGLDFCKGVGVVVEGPLDCLVLGPGSVATFGVKVTKAQLALIAELPIRYICMDAQEDAQRIARQLCEDLKMFPGRTENIVLESGKDPTEAKEWEKDQLRRLLA